MTSPSPQSDPRTDGTETAWTTASGTIRKGMKVIAPGGDCLGTVAAVEGEELILAEHAAGSPDSFVAMSQVDGVTDDAVLLSDRGDATFGLGAVP